MGARSTPKLGVTVQAGDGEGCIWQRGALLELGEGVWADVPGLSLLVRTLRVVQLPQEHTKGKHICCLCELPEL
jgi:hypothetical protein